MQLTYLHVTCNYVSLRLVPSRYLCVPMKPRAPQPNPQSSLNSIFSQLIYSLLHFLSGGSNFYFAWSFCTHALVELSRTILAQTSVTSLCTDPPPHFPHSSLLSGGGSVHRLSVTCCNLTYLPNKSVYILPTFLRTFFIICVILETLVFDLEEILEGELRCSNT